MAARGRASGLTGPILAAALLGGCAALAPVPPGPSIGLAELDTEPAPGHFVLPMQATEGPVVRILTATVAGHELTVTAARTATGVCVQTLRPGGGAGSHCGGLPGGVLGETFGTLGSGATSGVFKEVSGIVAPEVAAVTVEVAPDQHVDAVLVPLDPIDVDADYFLAVIPERASATSVIALAADGTIIERFSFEPEAGAP